jgi:hypothetical protein
MRHYLILENEADYVRNIYQTSQTDSVGTDQEFTFVHVTSVDEARRELAKTRFTGAILDLHLAGGTSAEGNEVARQIHRDYLMPIAVVSGFLDELDQEFVDIARDNTGFFRLFNKNKMIGDVFGFLFEMEQSGVLQIVGPGGEMANLLSEIFWKHLSVVVAQWRGQEMLPQDRKRVLRHAVAHMIGALQNDASGDWDQWLPGEVYIWPAICPKEMTGDIYEELVENEGTNQFFLLATPACDLASKTTSGAVRHVLKILPFADFPSNSKIDNKISKKEYRYHVLPPTGFFVGGVADFASLSVLPATDMDTRFRRVGSLVEPCWREIVNRLGAWLGRQGTPEFDRASLLATIKINGLLDLQIGDQPKPPDRMNTQLPEERRSQKQGQWPTGFMPVGFNLPLT